MLFCQYQAFDIYRHGNIKNESMSLQKLHDIGGEEVFCSEQWLLKKLSGIE